MAIPFLSAVDLNKNELQNVRIQNLASAPGSPVKGQIYYNTTDDTYYGWDGSSWLDLGSGSGGDADTLNGQAGTYYLDRTNHTGTQTSGTISDFDTQVRTSRLDQMATPTANVSMGANKITNVADPTNDQDAATKAYIDQLVSTGIEFVDSVADQDLSTPPVSPTAGDRYIVAPTGTGDWSGHDNEIAEWDGSTWIFTSLAEGLTCWVDDEDALYTWNGSSWVQITTLSDLVAGSGLTKSGNTVNVGAGTGIQVNADDVAIDTDVVARKHSEAIGNGSDTDISVTHNLGTRDVVVEVFKNSGTYDTVICDVKRTDANTVQLSFATAPTSNEFNVIVTG